eukprot:jgi/Mesen1/10596/ME000086S10134
MDRGGNRERAGRQEEGLKRQEGKDGGRRRESKHGWKKEEGERGAQLMGKYGVVMKSQILAGGRGLGTFKNGVKGGKMLSQILVTKQTGEKGKPVNKLLVVQKLALINEMHFRIALNCASAGPCSYGHCVSAKEALYGLVKQVLLT